jgi:hypothetical protein
MKALMIALVLSAMVMAEDLFYFEGEDTGWQDANFISTEFDLADFGPYTGMEIYSITVMWMGPTGDTLSTELYVCDGHNPDTTDVLECVPVVAEVFWPYEEVTYVVNPTVVGTEFTVVVDQLDYEEHDVRLRLHSTPGSFGHSKCGSWFGSWGSIQAEFHIIVTGMMWTADLSQATWGSIKAGF